MEAGLTDQQWSIGELPAALEIQQLHTTKFDDMVI